MRFMWYLVLSFLGLLLPFLGFADNELWQYASPVPNVALVDGAPIFSFYVPSGARERQISISLLFYSNYNDPTSCTGVLLNKPYNNTCVCAGYEDRTYYVSQANLHKVINTFSPDDEGSVNCARIRDNKNFSVLIGKLTTCSGSECTNPSGETAALPADVTTGNACTC